LLKW
jgi:hypothetical protein